MLRETQAEFFIRTLEELRDQQLERQTARPRLELKAHAERFMKAFRGEFEYSGRPSEWALQSQQTAEEAVWQLREE